VGSEAKTKVRLQIFVQKYERHPAVFVNAHSRGLTGVTVCRMRETKDFRCRAFRHVTELRAESEPSNWMRRGEREGESRTHIRW